MVNKNNGVAFPHSSLKICHWNVHCQHTLYSHALVTVFSTLQVKCKIEMEINTPTVVRFTLVIVCTHNSGVWSVLYTVPGVY